MAVIEFDLDEALSFFNFNLLSFEKTRNAPIVPILRGKGVSFAAENFTYNDYFELKFIIKKDLRYTINKFDQLTLDQKSPEKTETLSELEKIYKIYSLYRTKSLVFIKNKDLFNKLFPGIRKLKLQELKNVFINELNLLKKRCSEANNLQDTALAKDALEKKLDQALDFFLNYAGEFKDYEEAKKLFGRSYKYTNNKTELIEGDYYLTEAMFDKVKNAKKKVEDLVKGSQENPPFLTMLNKFSIASVPDTADGFEVTLGLHYFDSIFSDVIIENYKKERKQKEKDKDGKETDNAQQKFYDDITKTIREIFAKDKNELTLQVFNIDRTSFEGEFAPEERRKTTGDKLYLDYNSAKTNIKFDYSQIAQFEIISYFQIAEVPIQGKSKPLKQNLGVANTTLSLRLIDKDTGADGLSKMMNEIQYLSELEQRKLRSNLKFPFLNALDMIGAELSDFHYSSDLESDGSISTIIFNCHGYEFKPDLQTQTLATQNINVPLTKDVIYYNLFNRYLRDVSYTSVSTIATAQERNKGWNELVLDSGNGDVYTMFDLAESYAVGSDKLGDEKTINDVFKAPEIFSDLYRFSDLFIEAKKITDFNVKNINFSQLSDYVKYGDGDLKELTEAKDKDVKKLLKDKEKTDKEKKEAQAKIKELQSMNNYFESFLKNKDTLKKCFLPEPDFSEDDAIVIQILKMMCLELGIDFPNISCADDLLDVLLEPFITSKIGIGSSALKKLGKDLRNGSLSVLKFFEKVLVKLGKKPEAVLENDVLPSYELFLRYGSRFTKMKEKDKNGYSKSEKELYNAMIDHVIAKLSKPKKGLTGTVQKNRFFELPSSFWEKRNSVSKSGESFYKTVEQFIDFDANIFLKYQKLKEKITKCLVFNII